MADYSFSSSRHEEIIKLEDIKLESNSKINIRTSEYDIIIIGEDIIKNVADQCDEVMLVNDFARKVVKCGGTVIPHPHTLDYFNLGEFGIYPGRPAGQPKRYSSQPSLSEKVVSAARKGDDRRKRNYVFNT